MKRNLTLVFALLLLFVVVAMVSCGSDKISITYDACGGTIPSGSPKSYTPGEAPDFSSVIPTKDGYEFAGWYIDSEYTTEFSEAAVTGKSVKLYAKWEIAGCSISYELNGGTLPQEAPTKHIPGERTSLVSPTRSGYIFEGWYADAEFKTYLLYIDKNVDEDITVYARWLDAPEKISEIPDQSRGYFGAGYDTIKVDISKYVDANGSNLVYSATSSNTDFATVAIENNLLLITIKLQPVRLI